MNNSQPTFYRIDILGEVSRGMKTKNKELFSQARATNQDWNILRTVQRGKVSKRHSQIHIWVENSEDFAIAIRGN